MADDPARPQRTPAHGSVKGMWRPRRGEPGEYRTPMPLPHDSDQHAEPSPITIPRHGGHVMVRDGDGWTPGLCITQDHAGRRAWCTWMTAGRVDLLRVESWVDWADVKPVGQECSSQPW